MDNTNGIPFLWDNIQENNLLGSLFSNQLNSLALISTSNAEIKKKTPFAFSPLSKNGSEVRDNFFKGSRNNTYRNFEFVIDQSSNINPPEKIKIIEDFFYSDTNNSGIYGDNKNNIQDKFLFKIKLFISQDKSQLEGVYLNETVKPEENEILLFLEDNKGDISGSTMYSKKGSGITTEKLKILINGGTNSIDKKGKKYNGYLKEIEKEYNINYDDLYEFLTVGEIKNKSLTIISTLLYVSSFFHLDVEVLNGIANAIKTTTNFIREKCLIEEKNWNPKKAEKGQKFSPLLLPNVDAIINNIDDAEINKYIEKSINNTKQLINEYNPIIVNTLKVISKAENFKDTLTLNPKESRSITLILLEKYEILKSEFLKLLDKVKNIDFSTVINDLASIVNAFLCGLWNGFIEAVCGIISLIQYIFEALAFVTDLSKNFNTMFPTILEKIDDIILSYQQIDFEKIINKLAESLKNWLTSDFTVSLVEIAYFSGAFIGFVVELAIEIAVGILVSGGIISIEAILAKLGEVFVSFGKLLLGVVKLPVKAAQKTFSALLNGLHWVYEFLAKGTDEILKIIDEVFAKLKQLKEEFLVKTKEIFSKETKTDEFFRKIEKKFNLAGHEILSTNEIKKLRRFLKETFDVSLEFVDGNPALKAKLKDWTARRVAGSFNMIEGVMYLRKSVTAYTVQHEMFHMKLWYKMTKEFPELQSLFQKTLGVENRLFHEEFVLTEFMKNPSKWEEADLLNDLKFINELRRKKNLPEVNLEFYKKWNLEQELLKFN